MERTVKVKEYIAYVVKNLKYVVIAMLAGAVLLGVYQGVVQGTKATASAVNEYEDKLAAADSAIADKKAEIAQKQEEIDKSLLTRLDVNKIYLCSKNISVVLADEKGTTTQQDRVRKFYTAIWSGCNLKEELGLTDAAYQDAEDDGLRDVITLTNTSDMLILRAYAPTEEEARMLSDAAYQYILKIHPDAEKNTFAHELEKLLDSTKTTTLSRITSAQKENNDALAKLETELAALEKSRDAIKAPSVSAGKIIEYIVLGLFAGLLLSLLWLLIWCIANGKVLSSDQLSRDVGLQYIGTTCYERGRLNKAAAVLAGEPQWKNKAQAEEYAVQNAENLLGKSKKVLITSSEEEKSLSQKIDVFADAISGSGREIVIRSNYPENTEALEQIEQYDAVILAENKETAKERNIYKVAEAVKAVNKPLIGFILY